MLPLILSSLIFAACLGIIFSEKLNRTITALAGASLMIGLGKLIGFYSEADAIASIDWNTLGLLLGMMILVAMLEPTGFFQYLAVWASRLSKGRPVILLILLGAVTTLLSMFLDNVTTVVLIAPVTILISEVLGLSPAPFLITEALLSNTGGVATLVGDPPNVLIGSAAGFSFNDFLIHSLPVVAVAWLATLLLLMVLFQKELKTIPANQAAVLSLNPGEALNDRRSAIRILIVIGGAIVFFFLHSLLHLTPAFVALTAAAIALLVVRPQVSEILKNVEWSVLIFFGALFVMVGGLEKAGALERVVSLMEHGTSIPPSLFGILVIWVVAILSAVVDNVPITIALIPVIEGLGKAGINPDPLWWALVFGAGFGGNGTIIGSTANIVVATLSEKTKSPITSTLWIKKGLPVMVLTCIIASLVYLFAYGLFIE
ncbi:MAG: ArsB/NhaD family transporter [Anaerolineaceae bacterium]|nr:ArsB/NhaD family transporter [Anaerolineaceae bacterium]